MPARMPEETSTGIKWKQYAAGGPRDLVADGGGAARKIVLGEPGALTLCEDINNVDSPIAQSMPQGWEHTAAVTRVTSTGTIIVYW